MFDGQLGDSRRERLLDDFMNREQPKVLLMSVQAGGVGLTLTAANHVFHFDHWWNPAIARQAEGRAHRIGQTQTVFVHDLYTSGTIEERIHDKLQEKQALFDAVIDDLSAEYVQGAFTDEDLFGLFDLKPPGSGSKPTDEQPTSENIDKLTPAEFEQFVAKIYSGMGFRVDVTGQSRDGGVDIIGRRPNEFGVEKIIVQCKHFPGHVVGEPVVRELLGARQEHQDAQVAVIVTSGRFSKGAITLADRHNVKLIDRLDLQRLAEHYLQRYSGR
jgi:hypothetical protein